MDTSRCHLVDATTARADLAGPGEDAVECPAEHHVELHGHRMRYLEAGADRGGPALVLLHGLASDADTWRHVLPALARRTHVIAPDLLGFGGSAKPRNADYSVGAHAARLRDLLRLLGPRHAVVVGHSFGGGVAMAFGYQFPERTAGLGLIASGGLGPELTVLLRAATVPGVTFAARNLVSATPGWLRGAVRRTVAGLGLVGDSELDAVARALRSLEHDGAAEAFGRTLRTAVGWSGQRVAAVDRLYLLAELPVLLVAGRRDACIPYAHTVAAHRAMPASRLALLDGGHFPHHEHPAAVSELILGLLAGESLPRPAARAS